MALLHADMAGAKQPDGEDFIVSETRVAPRFEREETPATRLEVAALPPPELPGRGPGTLALLASGAGVLVLGLAGLQAGNFVAAQFARGPALGWLTLAVAVSGFGLIGAGIWRELRGLLALRTVDHLRAALADPARTRAAARAWAEDLPDGAALLPALAALEDPAAIRALLRAGPVAGMQARAERLGQVAAVQVFAAASAVPSPALDGLLVAWRGARLVRQVAELHGLRPGTLATLSLLRRTALSAASVAAADMAVDAASRAFLTSPALRHLAGDVAGAAVAARRLVVLARAASAACCPLPPES
jgi:putative membrane protein